MAIKQIITDDLTGETLPDGIKPIDVRVDGADYSIYLSKESKKTFVAFLNGEAPLLQQPVKSTARPAPQRKAIETYGLDFNEVRAWAIANKKVTKSGRPVSETTRVLNQDIYDEYKAAKK